MIALLHFWNIFAAYLWYRFLSRHLHHTIDKQSQGILWWFFGAGVFSVMLTWILHAVYPVPWLVRYVYESDLIYGIFVTGVVEETAKWFCFILVAHFIGTVKEPQDGVLQGAAVGLGFATIENIDYIMTYPELFIAVRPVLCTGGHMLYGAVWGGLYAAAQWSNARSYDPGSYRVAFYGVLFMAAFHGTYNTVVVNGILFGILVKSVILFISLVLFFHLLKRSPYRVYPLRRADTAVAALERGLFFNRKSPILNRRLGIYLMYKGRYKQAAKHFSRAVPRTRDRLSVRFFSAVCGFVYLTGHHAKKDLKRAWGRLSDKRREKLLSQVRILLKHDPELLEKIEEFLASAFTERRGKQGYALARELKRRKAERRYGPEPGPVLEELTRELTAEERKALLRQLKTAESRK